MFYKRKYLLLFIPFFLILLSFTTKGQNNDTVINKLSEGLGNTASLTEARYIMFSCISETHEDMIGKHTFLYDWETKDSRFEGETSNGESLIVLFNTETQSGEVYIDQEKRDSSNLVQATLKLFSEDSYLLFTPILIANRTLKTTVQESQIIDSKRHYVLQVNYPSANFEYAQLFIDSQNGTISKWLTFDQSDKLVQEFFITNIKDVGGGLTLATKFTDKINGKVIEYPIVAALLNIEAEKFKIP